MSENSKKAAAALNRIAAQLPMVDRHDLAGLAAILSSLEEIQGFASLPKAFLGLAARSEKLVNLMIMGETDFNAGLKKLNESVLKMQHGLDDEEKRGDSAPREPKSAVASGGKSADVGARDGSYESADEIDDLLPKFAGQQQSVLEDFEAYILELEKGNPSARAAIKRVLHTWKGEFGVLGLQEYSGFIHAVEELLENGTLSVDHLFRLKDLLASRLSLFAAGKRPALTDADRKAILGADETNSAVSPTADEQESRSEVTAKISESSAAEANAAVAADQVPTSGDRAFEGDPSLMGDFVAESRDHIHTAETLLLELETDPTNAENLNSIFRACHTIKGVAGFLGLKDVATLAHSMENLMDMARKAELVLTPAHIDILLESTDCMKALVEVIEGVVAGGAYVVPPSYRPVMDKLSSPILAAANAPVSRPEFAGKKLGEILVAQGTATAEDVADAAARQQAGDPRKLGEILIDKKDVPAREVGNALAAQTQGHQAKAVEETIRVPIGRLDQLIDAIGEAVIAQSMIFADNAVRLTGDQGLDKKLANATLIMRQIQELSMSLRMVSIKATFQKMARLVRDLSKKVGKEVEFITEGEDTELDKSVVENIGDPLIHMVRNSLDHGLETVEARRAAGKPVIGKLALRAFHKAGNIFIEIEDDGHGLDLEAIREKAIQKGLCKADDKYSDQEIYHFIFLPGFSTAKVITDVSGRGVGMDVVRRNIEALRGSVDIHSTPGKGTKFSIRLPLTLAIIDGMVVRVGMESFIIPTLSILESLKPTADQVETLMQRAEMVKVRGTLIPLFRLSTLFTGNGVHKDPTQCIVMIVEDSLGKRIGLMVDEILGQQQVVIKSLGTGMGSVVGVSGGAIMSDGRVSLILDISGIMRVAGERVEREELAPA